MFALGLWLLAASLKTFLLKNAQLMGAAKNLLCALGCAAVVRRLGRALPRQLHRLRLLRLVRMLVAAVHLQLGRHLAAELGVRQHAGDGVFDQTLRAARQTLLELFRAQAAREAGVAVVF